jgi:anti-sigma-K factor RskA
MGIDPRNNGRDLTRITISGGKRAEPRLMMAHRTRRQQVIDLLSYRNRTDDTWTNPPTWKLLVVALAIVVIIALAGASR